MAVLLSARNLVKHFAGRTLFSSVSIHVDERERLALIGPNGAGKSTLLKILAGIEPSDGGEITLRRGLRVAYVAQSDTFPDGATVRSAVVQHLEPLLEAGKLPHVHDHHELELEAELTLGRVGLEDWDAPCATLSGGQRKRLSIARGIAQQPDLLLLDEPTNHLDVEGINWLEDMLRREPFASIVITHDRTFLEKTATRIVELSHAYAEGTFSVLGGYSEFLRRKTEFLEAQAKQEQSLSNQVREDLRWLSRGAQARRTKSKSRIDASFERMDELAELRARNAPAQAAQIDFTATDRQTHKLLVGRGLSKTLGGRRLFENLDILLSPGSCLGLMGPNGAGKSTLLKILTGDLTSDPPTEAMLREEAARKGTLPHGTPDLGTIRRAENLRIVTFSQHRTELDPDATLGETLSPSDGVFYRGQNLHIVTWAEMFLFQKEDLRGRISTLSGGEQARVHIARLMLEPADVLILDEPTNDLDLASLEVLESSLEEFPGAIVLVTHDRAMIDRLATRILALDGHGNARYFADYPQWEQAAKVFGEASRAESELRPPQAKPAPAALPAVPKPTGKKKLSYKDQLELDGMEAAINNAESQLHALEARMSEPGVIADHRKMAEVSAEMAKVQQRIQALYARWEELEAKTA